LLEQGTKETVVLEGSHVGIRKKSAGIFSEPDAKGTVTGQPFVYRVNLSQWLAAQTSIGNGVCVGAGLPAMASTGSG
jgi:hypothetical protein